MMKLSIVTVSFNQGKFLRTAIESVLTQGYDELEYIVVDPGSIDGSREIITEYADRLAKVLLEPDAGAADGLNKGFAHATGSIYGFLNADDMLLPGALHSVADCFRQNPGVDIVMGDGFIADERGIPLRRVKAVSFTPMRLIYGGTTSLQQSTFFRSKAFAASDGFNVSNKSSWDIELFLGMVTRGARIKYLRRDLAIFRIHDNSITGSDRLREAYRLDCDRLFYSVRGRNWRAVDNLRMVYYKSLRFIADPLALITAITSRIGLINRMRTASHLPRPGGAK